MDVFAYFANDCSLRALTIVTLVHVVSCHSLDLGSCNRNCTDTHKKPTQNMDKIWIFFRSDMDRLASSGNGNIIVARSRTRFNAAAIHPCMLISLHVASNVPSQASHAPAIGLHCQMEMTSNVMR